MVIAVDAVLVLNEVAVLDVSPHLPFRILGMFQVVWLIVLATNWENSADLFIGFHLLQTQKGRPASKTDRPHGLVKLLVIDCSTVDEKFPAGEGIDHLEETGGL